MTTETKLELLQEILSLHRKVIETMKEGPHGLDGDKTLSNVSKSLVIAADHMVNALKK